ncbi:alpha/beta hydrolase [Lactobacillus sp. LL6]|uniref:alpha/beta hydrolase n=1 Tax=Lactobacillus sp. LL6 TaxID=2596827 RepID=UPI001F5B6616|nr:alpha/beta hydrolase [Lactobacillus sp. LL6]
MNKHFMKKSDLDKMPSDYIEPIDESYEDFPKSSLNPTGLKSLKVDLKNNYPKVDLNVPYAVKDGKELHLQIIIPPINHPQERFPLIMYVQGSAFHKQDLGLHLAHMIEVAKHGYVVAMVEYRYAPEHIFPVQVRDLNTATRFMLEHSNQYHIDSKNYIAWGDSSGGHTVALASVTEDKQFFSDEDIDVFPLNFKASIDFYGPTDISQMNKVPSTQDHVTEHSLEGELFGSINLYENPDIVQKANPINYISKDKTIPPFLIMHGDKDRLVPFQQSCLLYEALKENNKIVEFYRIDDSDHATDAFFTSEALEIVFAFLKETDKDNN